MNLNVRLLTPATEYFIKMDPKPQRLIYTVPAFETWEL